MHATQLAPARTASGPCSGRATSPRTSKAAVWNAGEGDKPRPGTPIASLSLAAVMLGAIHGIWTRRAASTIVKIKLILQARYDEVQRIFATSDLRSTRIEVVERPVCVKAFIVQAHCHGHRSRSGTIARLSQLGHDQLLELGSRLLRL
jgi:hypothetical protein